MSHTIDNTDDIIDSRDVIARIEELEAEREALADHVNECQDAYDFHDSDDTKSTPEWKDLSDAIDALALWDESDEAKELGILQALAKEAEGASDWIHGESLIHEDYFVTYIEDLIKDCYPLPKELDSGDWPYRHITIDYEAAADEARADYMDVYFDGQTYLIRA